MRGRNTVVAVITAALLVLGVTPVAYADVQSWPDYTRIGEQITGSAEVGSAPEIEAGDWTDELGPAGGDRGELFYRLQRTLDNSSFHVSATLISSGSDSDGISVEAINAEESCASADTSSSDQYGPLTTAGIVVPREPDDEGCVGNEEYVLKITRSDNGLDFATPIEIRIIEEPAAQGVDALPEDLDAPDYTDPEPAEERQQTTGAAGFAEPTAITPGSYSGTISSNTVQVFAVEVDWGQRLRTKAVTPILTQDYEAALESGTPYLSARVFAPDRAPVNESFDFSGPLQETGTAVSSSTTMIGYRNREAFTAGTTSASLAGTYFIVVALSALPDEQLEVGYELDVAVDGEPNGAPTYVDNDPVKVPDGQGGIERDGGPVGQLLRIGGLVIIGLGVAGVLGGAIVLIVYAVRRTR